MSFRADRVAARAGASIAVLAVFAAGPSLAGCGSSSSGTSSSSSSTTTSAPSTTSSTSTPTAATTPASTSTSATSGQTLSLAANPQGELKYDTTALSAKAGKVSIDFTNMSPLAHNVTVESSSHAIEGATPTFQGATKTLSLDLKPGVYKFFCSVPGHRMAGMEGTLTVH